MTHKDFDNFYKQLLEECIQILKSKGTAYSGTEDRFGNFKRLEKQLGISRFLIWKVYFQKHLDAIDSFIRGEYHDSEPIRGRIVDCINYLLLLGGMIDEKTTIVSSI